MELQDPETKKRRTYPMAVFLGGVGLGIIIISFVRWFFMFPDPSQLFLGVSSGGGYLLGAYLYNWMRNSDNIHKDLYDKIKELETI